MHARGVCDGSVAVHPEPAPGCRSAVRSMPSAIKCPGLVETAFL